MYEYIKVENCCRAETIASTKPTNIAIIHLVQITTDYRNLQHAGIQVEQMKPEYKKQKCSENLVPKPRGYIQGYKLPSYSLVYPTTPKLKSSDTHMIPTHNPSSLVIIHLGHRLGLQGILLGRSRTCWKRLVISSIASSSTSCCSTACSRCAMT
jgi:hypothetical protein